MCTARIKKRITNSLSAAKKGLVTGGYISLTCTLSVMYVIYNDAAKKNISLTSNELIDILIKPIIAVDAEILKFQTILILSSYILPAIQASVQSDSHLGSAFDIMSAAIAGKIVSEISSSTPAPLLISGVSAVFGFFRDINNEEDNNNKLEHKENKQSLIISTK